MKRALFIFVLFAMPASLSAFADDAADNNGPGYYRSTMPDGSIVFGDKPAKGAAKSVFVPMNTQNQNIIKPNEQDEKAAKTADQNFAQRKQALDDADSELKQAQQELADAQAALANGQEPQEGERIGTANGTNQLTDAYFDRIKQLQDAVTAAQQRVDEAQQKVNDARY